MPRLKLTKTAIERLRAPDPSGRQTLYWDTELKGFGVLVSGRKDTKTFVVQRDLPGGRTRRVTIAPVNVVAFDKARERAKAFLAEFYQGHDPKERAASGTLQQVLDDYLAGKAKLSARTRELYRDDIAKHLKGWLGRPLASITRDEVEDRHKRIAKEIAEAGRYPGHAQANRTMIVFRALWNWAARRDEKLPANPVKARLHGNWHPVARRDRLVKASELPAFYAAVRALPNAIAADYLTLLLFTGLRRREAAGLTWAMIDFDEDVIRLPASATKAKRKLDLPMSSVVRKMLAARRKLGAGAFVFEANGKTGHLQEPKFFLGQVAAATGISVSAHDLRRTFITVAESADISPSALKALVNHSLGSDVTAGYIAMTADRLREPAQRVADQMLKLCRVKQTKSLHLK